jgi:hypothetical protein
MTLSVSNLKRRAKRVGIRFCRSNWRRDSIDNLGGYQVMDVARNCVVEGDRFNADLEDVARVIEREEASL